MTLVVETPPTHPSERRYVLDIVLGRWLGLEWTWVPSDRTDVRISVSGDIPTADGSARDARGSDDVRKVVIPDVLFTTDRWLESASLPSSPLRRVEDPTESLGAARMPVIYGSPSAPASLMLTGMGASLAVDVFGSVFFMLTRYEEGISPERDAYDRFPMAASLAAREGFAMQPLADAYVELLWAAIVSQWPRLERRQHAYRLRLTHDVDFARASDDRSPKHLVRAVAGDVARRRDVDLARRRVSAFVERRRDPATLRTTDPFDTFADLMSVSEKHGIASTFYVMASGEPASTGGNYDVSSPWMAARLMEIHRRGHQIGLHGSFETHADGPALRREVDRLVGVMDRTGVRQDGLGGRQHFLRWSNLTTWRNYASAGLVHDTTVGYAEGVGFRAGTCRDYPAFDLSSARELDVVERPLHVMDGALIPYLGVASDTALEQVITVAETCRRFQGAFSLLWHNTSLATRAEHRQYEDLIATLASG